jgi:hypothetical protein
VWCSGTREGEIAGSNPTGRVVREKCRDLPSVEHWPVGASPIKKNLQFFRFFFISNFAECENKRHSAKTALPTLFFTEWNLPNVTLDKGFAECYYGFGVRIR